MKVAWPIIRTAAWGIREEMVDEYLNEVDMKSIKVGRPGRLLMALWKASSVVQVRAASMPPSVRALRSMNPLPLDKGAKDGSQGLNASVHLRLEGCWSGRRSCRGDEAVVGWYSKSVEGRWVGLRDLVVVDVGGCWRGGLGGLVGGGCVILEVLGACVCELGRRGGPWGRCLT